MGLAGNRKRAAPGASATVQHQQRSGVEHNAVMPTATQEQYMPWPQQPLSSTAINYPDPSSNYNSNLYNANTQLQTAPASGSNQLARRPLAQQLVSRGNYNNSGNETWPLVADESMQPTNEDAWMNNLDDLEQRAMMAKRETQAKRKQIPPFVQKLSSFLDESRNTELIRWSDSGDSFIVVDEDEFAKTLIPELFKHNNYASFVRQLNMYGFHKKVGLSDNSMRASERKNKSPSEYSNPFFKCGRPNLLWLIQKPKNPLGKGPGKGVTRVKQEDGNVDEDGDEGLDRENSVPPIHGPIDGGTSLRSGRQPLMISDGTIGLPQQDFASLQRELQEVRHQQDMIKNMLAQVRRDHEQLYTQAAAFQSLHDRHESSINAILTFLATVYNRSLEGQGGQNFANLFSGAIPEDTQGQGNVVDVGDGEYADQRTSNVKGQTSRPFRRQPLLLKGAPSQNTDAQTGRATTVSPATSAESPRQRPQARVPLMQGQSGPYNMRNQAAANSPALQEIFDQTPSARASQSPQLKADNEEDGQIPEADIMSMINSTNANSTNFPGVRMDFPQALDHLQNAEGKTPLTPNQRNDVLQLMANGSANTSQNNNNNALTFPSPPAVPDLAHYNTTKEKLEHIHNHIQAQGERVNELHGLLAPLSPSGSIPGVTDAQGYNNPGSDLLDLDQIFNSNDYFNDSNMNTTDIDFSTNNEVPDFNFDTSGAGQEQGDGGLQGFANVGEEDGSPLVHTTDGSEATSPANTAMVGEDDEGNEVQSPGKRRKRN